MRALGAWHQTVGEGGHGCVTLEEASEAKGEREDLISQNGAGRAQGLAAGEGKGG